MKVEAAEYTETAHHPDRNFQKLMATFSHDTTATNSRAVSLGMKGSASNLQ